MGMFDTVICKRIMPDGFDGRNGDFQTKDLERTLAVFTITRDGRLVVDRTKSIPVKNPKRPFKNPKHIRNIIKNIHAEWRTVKLPREHVKFTGQLNFYTYDQSTRDPMLPYDHKYWHEYLATFKRGKLVNIRVFNRDEEVRPIVKKTKKKRK